MSTSAASEIAPGAQVHLHPAASGWPSQVAARFSQLNDRARTFRAELGLDPSRPVVMSGHQPQFWHPGILAKLLALYATARRVRDGQTGDSGAQAAWLVVDHDETSVGVRYPVIDRAGVVIARTLALDGDPATITQSRAESLTSVPLARRAPTLSIAEPNLAAGERFAANGVEPGLRQLTDAMRHHSQERNIARQIARASIECASKIAHCEPPILVFATDVARTALMRELLGTMASDAQRCVSLYNSAAAAHPSARVAALALGDDPELPIWRLGAAMGSPRRHARAAMLSGEPGAAAISAGEFVPRALLLTGLMRLASCDLFIHGLGGGGSGSDEEGGYDAITTRWLRDWLGEEIGPLAVASATLRLRMTTDRPMITPAQVAHAQWLAHAAGHRPDLLDDNEGALQRQSAVATLTKLRNRRDPASRAAKNSAYRDLHRALQAARVRGSSTLQALKDSADAAAGRRAEAELLADRTWASVLYEPVQIDELRVRIESAFEGR